MRQFGKLTKFFIICAAVLVAGIICTIIGVTTGGVQDMNKVAEKYDWIQLDSANAGERGVTGYPMEEFHAIDIRTDADVYLLGKQFYKNASRLTSDEILYSTETDVLGDNKVIVIAGDSLPQPVIEVNEGVLTISDNEEEDKVPWTPTILICCPMDMMDSLQVKNNYCDLHCLGVAWKNANIKVAAGDIHMEGVTSGGLSLNMDSGDAKLEGEFLKRTTIDTAAGDVSLETAFARTEYAMDLYTAAGDITVKEPGSDPAEYDDTPAQVKQAGGPNNLTMKSDSGDLKVSFGGGMDL